MFIGYDKKYNDFASIEIKIVNHKLSISGIIGEFMNEDKLYELINDYWDSIDLEDEFGYLADEQGIDDEDLRIEYLENLEYDLRSSDEYPYEVDKWYNSYVHILHSAGQNDDEISHMMPLINQGDFNFILDVWKHNQLKIISPEIEDTLNHIFLRYDEDLMLEKIINLVE